MTDRDPAYLAAVREDTCVIGGLCDSVKTEAHHAFGSMLGGGKSIKGSDYGAVPLCHRHHMKVHSKGPSDEDLLRFFLYSTRKLAYYFMTGRDRTTKQVTVLLGSTLREYLDTIQTLWPRDDGE